LTGSGSRQELAESDQVRKCRLIEPFSPDDQFVAEVTDMCDRTAKGAQTQLEEGGENLTDCPSLRNLPGK